MLAWLQMKPNRGKWCVCDLTYSFELRVCVRERVQWALLVNECRFIEFKHHAHKASSCVTHQEIAPLPPCVCGNEDERKSDSERKSNFSHIGDIGVHCMFNAINHRHFTYRISSPFFFFTFVLSGIRVCVHVRVCLECAVQPQALESGRRVEVWCV